MPHWNPGQIMINRLDSSSMTFVNEVIELTSSLNSTTSELSHVLEEVRSNIEGVEHRITAVENEQKIDGGWNAWAAWTSCTATCNSGLKTRQRQCVNPRPSGGGQYCDGAPIEVVECNQNSCPKIDDGWNAWASWTSCTATCNSGLKTRQRQCVNPRPSGGGQYCDGDPIAVVECNQNSCPNIDGGWNAWAAWTSCTATCNSGLKTRQRQCANPRPSGGGQYCDGAPIEVVECNQNPCPKIDGGWNAWAAWTSCTATCNSGLKTRQRHCANPRPSGGGQYCDGAPIEVVECNQNHCPKIDDGWNEWVAWTSCTATCNSGLKTRQRQCVKPRPSGGDQYCDGAPIEVVECNQNRCPRTKSSFTAKHATRLSTGILSFSRVLLNENSNFDGSSGTFTCQHSGLYFFTVLVNEGGRDRNTVDCYITLNDSNHVRLLYHNAEDSTNTNTRNGYGVVTGSATFHLTNGDRVNVWCGPSTSAVSWSSFTGFLIA